MFSSSSLNRFGAIGVQMINQGLIWLSLGFSGNNRLCVNINDSINNMVIFSPLSIRQECILTRWYSFQFKQMNDSIIIDCLESPRIARKRLLTAHSEGFRNIMIIHPYELFKGVKTAFKKHLITNALNEIMHDDNIHVFIIESFRSDDKFIGDLSSSCDSVMTVGTMTPMKSQIAFGNANANNIKGNWHAYASIKGLKSFGFSIKDHIPPSLLTKAA